MQLVAEMRNAGCRSGGVRLYFQPCSIDGDLSNVKKLIELP